MALTGAERQRRYEQKTKLLKLQTRQHATTVEVVRPLTAAERQRRFREKKKLLQLEVMRTGRQPPPKKDEKIEAYEKLLELTNLGRPMTSTERTQRCYWKKKVERLEVCDAQLSYQLVSNPKFVHSQNPIASRKTKKKRRQVVNKVKPSSACATTYPELKQSFVLLDRVEPSRALESVLVKEEPMDVLNFVEEMYYCRCCFKLLSLLEVQIPVEDDTLRALQDITQLEIEASSFAPSFCENCFNDIRSFDKFRKLTVVKQEKFKDIMRSSGGFGLNELNDITLSSDPMFKDEDEDESVIKEETIKFEVADFSMELPEAADDGNSHGGDDVEDEKPVAPVEVKKKRGRVFPKCPYCFANTVYLPRHLLHCHPIKCGHCKFLAGMQWEIDKHVKKMHKYLDPANRKQFICPHCGKFVKISMDKHIAAVHKNKKNFFCDLCEYSSFQRSCMIKHMKSIHLAKKIYCEMCDFVTVSSYLLNRHLKQAHTTKEEAPRSECLECGRSFKCKFYLEEHVLRKHVGTKNFQCSECGNKFFSQVELK
jgi:hypothetical protein